MNHPSVVVNVLLALATVGVWLTALGVLLMRDAYQRVHFVSLLAGVSAPLLLAAVFVQETSLQARLKACAAVSIVILANGVLSHATARAKYIREAKRWKFPSTRKVA